MEHMTAIAFPDPLSRFELKPVPIAGAGRLVFDVVAGARYRVSADMAGRVALAAIDTATRNPLGYVVARGLRDRRFVTFLVPENCPHVEVMIGTAVDGGTGEVGGIRVELVDVPT
jgi:hypothetical protein